MPRETKPHTTMVRRTRRPARRPTGAAASAVAVVAAVGLLASACSNGDDTAAGPAGGDATSVPGSSAGPDTTGDGPGSTDGEPAPSIVSGDDVDVVADETGEPVYAVEGELPLSEGEIIDVVRFVEAETGRDFDDPPVLVGLGDEEYVDASTALLDRQLAAAEEHVDVAARYYQVMAGSELGAEELVARVREAGPVVGTSWEASYSRSDQVVLVHVEAHDLDLLRADLASELAVALVDQQIDVDALDADPDLVLGPGAVPGGGLDEVNHLVRAIVGGFAHNMRFAWEDRTGVSPDAASMVDDPRTAAVDPADGRQPFAVEHDLPVPLVWETFLPPIRGQDIVRHNGGLSGAWTLFDEGLPANVMVAETGDEEDVAPIDEAADVEVEPPPGEVIRSGTFGAYDVLAATAPVGLDDDSQDWTAYWMAAFFWAGGSYVLTGDDAESCISIGVTTYEVSNEDLSTPEVMHDMFDTWRLRAPTQRTVELDDDTTRATACAPYAP
ncbi:MAG: hypothetical protein S0880_13760 [Actinomycetota bacterium]|nr:hypothetical protein [Actinomycetota bacterium]